MATSPAFTVAPPVVGVAALATASTGYGTAAPTNAVLLFTAGVNGSRIDRVVIKGAATTASAVVRFFYSIDSGTTNYLLAEILVTAATGSTTVAQFESNTVVYWTLPANAKLYACTSVTQATHVVCFGGNF